MDKKVFAIIVIYNGMRRDWISKCFDSLLASTIPIEIIAVDNCSSDDSVSFIKQYYSEVKLIQSTKNIGFGGANNIGIKEAYKRGGDFFFLLNQDAWVQNNTIEKLISKSIENPDYAVLSPMHLNGVGDALDHNFSLQINPNQCPKLYSDIYLDKVQDKLYDVSFVCAAAWLLTAKSLRKVGGFSPMFFHYGEDDNYCHRVLFKGMKIGVCPSEVVFHDRQDRPKNANEDKSFLARKFLTLRFMNPNLQTDLRQEIKNLRLDNIKAVLKLDTMRVKRNIQEIKFLTELQKQMPKYAIRSNQEFQYLED